jgi:acylphosphatase
MVQGVGFRFSVQSAALRRHLTGWVKNLENGLVETTIEGPKDEVDALVDEIDELFSGYIKNKQANLETYQGEFQDFFIAY